MVGGLGSVRAKLNVVQLRRVCVDACTSFNFCEALAILFIFFSLLNLGASVQIGCRITFRGFVSGGDKYALTFCLRLMFVDITEP